MKRSGVLLITTVAALATVILLGQCLAQPAGRAAAPAPVAHVAVCDVVTVFNKYQRALDLAASFDEKERQIQAENKNRAKAIQQLRERLEALAPGSKEYRTQLKELLRLSNDRDAWTKTHRQAIVSEKSFLTEQMYKEILGAVAKVARQRGFDVILHRESVEVASRSPAELLNKIALRKCLYARDGLDLTKVVLERVNKEYRARRK